MAGFEHGGVNVWATRSDDGAGSPEGIAITNTSDDSGVSVSVAIHEGQPVGVIVTTSEDGGDTFKILSSWGLVPAWWAEC